MARRNVRKRGPRDGAADRPYLRALRRRGVAAGAVAALVVGGLAALQSGEGPPAGAPPAASLAASPTCEDLLVVAVDGNGQGGRGKPGAVTGRVVSDLVSRASAEGRSVAVHPVRFSTPGPATLVQQRQRRTTKAVTKPRVRAWRKPVAAGVRTTRQLVASQVRSCPEQQVVLVGYAQGAAVAHRVLQRLSPAQLSRVSGAVTVSDPWRVKRSVVGVPLGAPAAGRGSEGVLSRYAKRVGDVPRTTPAFRVVSVCTKGDLVCNPNATKASAAITKSRYATKAARRALSAAGWALWQRIALWPVPASAQVDVPVGTSFVERLTVSGGSTGSQAAAWTPTDLPDGVTLGRDGVLRGTLRTAGTYAVRYTVAGVNPATPARSGQTLLRASADWGGVSAGGRTSCEVRAQGEAWCWGSNEYGQVGDGTRTDRPDRTRVRGTGWSRISTGGAVTCGVKDNGSLWCWGLNDLGQLGRSDKANQSAPRRIGTGTTWRDVSVSWHHACALQADGTAWCWGSNANGQIGDGAVRKRTQGPVKVSGTARFTSLETGGHHSCGITRQGVARCWGGNLAGQLGDGTTAQRRKPTKVAGGAKFTMLSADWARTCGVTQRGEVQCWGDNAHGELGNGTRKSSTSPVTVSAAGRTWVTVAAGMSHTCAADTSGSVSCWGDNRYGQLGPAASAVARSLTPVDSGVEASGGALAAGWLHTCATSAACWGAGDAGQLATGRVAPVRMPAKAAPSWPRTTFLTTKQVRSRSAKRIASDVVAKRPAVSAAARSGSASFGVMSLNVLGTQHSAPGATRAAWAPGRARTEWARVLIERSNVSLVGMSEPQPDQITSYDQALSGGWTIYPGNTMGYPPAPQSVMWRDSDWELVWANTASMPFMRQARPQPVVRLRHRDSGREVYWINAHLSPGSMTTDRDKGLAIIVQLVKQLQKDGLPVLVTGDLNDKETAFRRIACDAQMVAAVGGSSTGGACKLPSHMRVDWVFGKGGTFSRTLVDTSAVVRRTTDHAVISSTFTVR